MHDKILILDFGSQVTQLIARRVREAHVYCEIHPNDVSDAFVREFAPKGIILSGSHASTYEEHDLRAPQAVWDSGVPVLGICYGMFTMAVQQGGQVQASTQREFGYAEVRAHGHTRLLNGIQDFATPEGHGMLKVWMSHGDKVTALPPGFKIIGSNESTPIAAMADEARRFYGGVLGCAEGRSTDTWVDFDFFSHQISLHLGPPFRTERTGHVGEHHHTDGPLCVRSPEFRAKAGATTDWAPGTPHCAGCPRCRTISPASSW